MGFIETLVNFLLLAGIVWLLGRKMIKKIFKSRRERINAELDEAERLELENGSAELCEPEPEAERPAPENAGNAELDELREKFNAEKTRID